MSKSPPKGNPPGAPAEDSLDFTAAKPARPATPAAPRPKKQPPPSDKPSGSRKTFVALLAAIGVAGVVALMLREEEPKEPITSPSTPVKRAAPPEPTAAAPTAPQPYPPPVQTAPPPGSSPAQAPKLESVRAMPPEFLKAVQDYNTKPGYKAIALALDSDGKWAYGSIAGFATQPGANAEALSECARFKSKSGAQSDCKLFAIGDKVVW